MSHALGTRHRGPSVLLATLACAAAVLGSAGTAKASDPFALYVVPSKVDLLPGDADATQVVIHGVFLQLTAPAPTTAPVYTSPRCGKMYFQCPTGQEELCRLQWEDIRKAVGAGYCAGFGTLDMVSSARLLEEAAPLATPDAWEMGMGVTQAYYLGGQCSKATMSSCADGAAGSLGAGGANGNGAAGSGAGGASAGAGGAVANGSTGGATGPSGSGGAPGPNGGGGGPAQTGPGGSNGSAVNGSGATVKKTGDGCSVAGTGAAIVDGGGLALAFGAALALGARRSRSRRRS